MVRQRYSGVALLFLASACNVKDPLLTTGGVTLDDGGVAEGSVSALDGAGGPDGAMPATAACAKALVVSNSDFTSTNISLLSPVGVALSESFISSGSAPTGLTTALSGDVVLPLEMPPSGRVVLLDRYPNSVLTWVDVASAGVLGQLSVRTGFFSNPQDYLELGNRAYVSRFETNANPGAMPNDGGGDILIIDTQAFAITGRIDLASPSDGAFQPRPSHLLRMGNEVWVVLQRYTADFSDAGDARVVGIDTATDQIAWTLDLPNVANCQGLARSPSGAAVALSCPGVGGSRSAVVLLDATAHPPAELKRFDVVASLPSKPGSPLAFASETLLVGATQGDSMAGLNDVAYTLDTASGIIAPLFDSGKAFSLGDVRCAPGCTDLCFVADAKANALRVWKIENGALVDPSMAPVDPSIGLPPRVVGAL